MSKKPRIQIYPVPGVTLYPWRPIPQEVTEKEWGELQQARPCPFTDQPPGSPEPQAPEPVIEAEAPDTGGPA